MALSRKGRSIHGTLTQSRPEAPTAVLSEWPQTHEIFSQAHAIGRGKAEFNRLQADVALHKAGFKKFGENKELTKFITLEELTDKVLAAKKHDVAPETIRRNRYVMKLFMEVLGRNFLVTDLKPIHFDQFKNARFEKVKKYYETRTPTAEKPAPSQP